MRRSVLVALAAGATAVTVGALVRRARRPVEQPPEEAAAFAAARAGVEPPVDEADADIAIVIPALNEADNIPAVLDAIPDSVLDRQVTTVLVDDGSTDDTRAVSLKHGATVASFPANQGGGAALRLGYQIASQLGADVVVTMDADGQHDPAELAGIVAPVLADEADFVIGSRALGADEAANATRAAGVHILSKVVTVMIRRPITDCSSGYRAFRTEQLVTLPLRERQFHTGETIIKSSKSGLRITEVPITISRRKSGESKKPKTIRYGTGFVAALFRAWLA
jgi:glycosyltransferase involved in cell wall biosynthesis